jgi:hypothetical protein
LIQEADHCRTMVETEVAKLKEKIESEAAEQCRIMVETEVAKADRRWRLKMSPFIKKSRLGRSIIIQ